MPLYDTVVEIDERVTLEDFSEDPYFTKSSPNEQEGILEGNSGEMVRVIKKPDESSVRSILKVLYASGIKSIAIAFYTHTLFQTMNELLVILPEKLGSLMFHYHLKSPQ